MIIPPVYSEIVPEVPITYEMINIEEDNNNNLATRVDRMANSRLDPNPKTRAYGEYTTALNPDIIPYGEYLKLPLGSLKDVKTYANNFALRSDLAQRENITRVLKQKMARRFAHNQYDVFSNNHGW
jgi:hypothetical protein